MEKDTAIPPRHRRILKKGDFMKGESSRFINLNEHIKEIEKK